MRNILAHPVESVYFKDLKSRFLLVSEGWLASEGHGRKPEDVIGKTDFDIFSERHAAAARADEQRVIGTGQPMVGKLERESFPDRPDVWVSATKLPLRDEHGAIVGTWGISRDVTAQREAETRLLDSERTLRSVIDNTPAAVHVKGLDYRYQLVNREFEVLFGVKSDWIVGRRDEDLLAAPAVAAARAKDRLVLEEGRTIQDEETLLHDGCERVFLTLRFPTFDEGGAIQAVCVMSTDITERHAEDLAGRKRLECSETINAALAQNRFVLYGQPIADLTSMHVDAHELLIRMLDLDGRLVAPCEFLPAAEEYGLIHLIDEWVVERACELATAGHHFAVNLSAKTICDPLQVESIERTIIASGAPPQNLVFEITETAAADNFSAARTFAMRLRKLGCGFALDDFGVGHGSFSYLKNLPVDYLKIDTQFVRDLGGDEENRQVVRAIVGVANQFKIRTIAEGIEDQATATELQKLGVDYAQGYWIGGRLRSLRRSHHQREGRSNTVPRKRELAKEQSLSDLEQALGDRAQLVGDREQSLIDHEQVVLDDQRDQRAIGSQPGDRLLGDGQARIDREQVTRDVDQEALDHSQLGRDNQQAALDETRAMLDLPTASQPTPATAGIIRAGSSARAVAARERAEDALIRAQAALVRAEAAAVRARAGVAED